MPELPEVEEVRRTLEPHLLGRRVLEIRAVRADFLTPRSAPIGKLVGHTFVQTLRHGKKLFCVADDSQTLLFHLGMSGHIAAVAAKTATKNHTHFLIRLAEKKGETEIRFTDPRRFGGVWYYSTLQEALAQEVTNRMGPDALELTIKDLAHWKKTRGKLKARLLGQKDVAGLGNIYVDEALWMSRLHPEQLVSRIRPSEREALVAAIHTVLRRSIEMGGTTLRDYRNVSDESGAFQGKLQAYGRSGEKCLRCGAILKETVTAGRDNSALPGLPETAVTGFTTEHT